MPEHKDLKRLVRARKSATGESYIAARTQLLAKRTRKTGQPPKTPYAQVAGMSDQAVEKKTGRTWAQWLNTLDAVDAYAMAHRDIARHLHEHHDLAGWWAQTVTVGYERLRGLRDKEQRRGGGHDVNKSKTVPVPIGRLYRAFATARERRRWLHGTELTVRTSTREKSIRFRTTEGQPVDAYFSSKGAQKSQVESQQRQVGTKADVEQAKQHWTAALSTLTATLSS